MCLVPYTYILFHIYIPFTIGIAVWLSPYTICPIPQSVYSLLFTLHFTQFQGFSLPCEVRWAFPATRLAFPRRLPATSPFDHCPPVSRVVWICFPIWVPAICPHPPLIRESSFLTSDHDPLRSVLPEPVAPAVNISPPLRLASLCGGPRSRLG